MRCGECFPPMHGERTGWTSELHKLSIPNADGWHDMKHLRQHGCQWLCSLWYTRCATLCTLFVWSRRVLRVHFDEQRNFITYSKLATSMAPVLDLYNFSNPRHRFSRHEVNVVHGVFHEREYLCLLRNTCSERFAVHCTRMIRHKLSVFNCPNVQTRKIRTVGWAQCLLMLCSWDMYRSSAAGTQIPCRKTTNNVSIKFAFLARNGKADQMEYEM